MDLRGCSVVDGPLRPLAALAGASREQALSAGGAVLQLCCQALPTNLPLGAAAPKAEAGHWAPWLDVVGFSSCTSSTSVIES